MKIYEVKISISATDPREWDDTELDRLGEDGMEIDFQSIVVNRLKEKGFHHFQVNVEG